MAKTVENSNLKKRCELAAYFLAESFLA